MTRHKKSVLKGWTLQKMTPNTQVTAQFARCCNRRPSRNMSSVLLVVYISVPTLKNSSADTFNSWIMQIEFEYSTVGKYYFRLIWNFFCVQSIHVSKLPWKNMMYSFLFLSTFWSFDCYSWLPNGNTKDFTLRYHALRSVFSQTCDQLLWKF